MSTWDTWLTAFSLAGLAIILMLGLRAILDPRLTQILADHNAAEAAMPAVDMPPGVPWPPPPAAAVTRTMPCGCVTLLDPPGTVPCHTHAEVIPQP